MSRRGPLPATADASPSPVFNRGGIEVSPSVTMPLRAPPGRPLRHTGGGGQGEGKTGAASGRASPASPRDSASGSSRSLNAKLIARMSTRFPRDVPWYILNPKVWPAGWVVWWESRGVTPSFHTSDRAAPSRCRHRVRAHARVTCVIAVQATFLSRWDVYVVLLLVYTAVVTPVEVAFLTTSLNALFVLNRIVDASFVVVRWRPLVSYWERHITCCVPVSSFSDSPLIARRRACSDVSPCMSGHVSYEQDMGLMFVTARFDDERGRWLTTPRELAHAYMGKWFLIDLVRCGWRGGAVVDRCGLCHAVC